jgi:hypothetical protein
MVREIGRAFRLQPHREETFKISKDPYFMKKTRDVVGLYLNPPDKTLVLGGDEKSHIQALNRTQPLIPMKPGQAERRRHDSERHGRPRFSLRLIRLLAKLLLTVTNVIVLRNSENFLRAKFRSNRRSATW